MKKILIVLLLLIVIPINMVKAIEYPEITEDIEIRYKWYKEVVEGDYYLKKEQLDGYLVDNSKVKYGSLNNWNADYCNVSDEYYMKEYDFNYTYKKVLSVRYVELENFTFDNNIEIYQNNELVDYQLISNDGSVVIDLKNTYFAEDLIFYIKSDKAYKINLYKEKYLTQVVLSKNVDNDELLIPDETWIIETTPYEKYSTADVHRETGLTTKIKQYQVCRYREIYVYKYKISREYYDDNYHLNVDGYIKDTDDYQVFYKGTPITTTIEITNEKIIKEPQTEYIYIQNENTTQETDSSFKIECPSQTIECSSQTKTKIEYLEKAIFKVPKKVYIIIVLLILIIIFLIAKLYKKYVV